MIWDCNHTAISNRFEPHCSHCWFIRWHAMIKGAMELVTYAKFEALDKLRGWKEKRKV